MRTTRTTQPLYDVTIVSTSNTRSGLQNKVALRPIATDAGGLVPRHGSRTPQRTPILRIAGCISVLSLGWDGIFVRGRRRRRWGRRDGRRRRAHAKVPAVAAVIVDTPPERSIPSMWSSSSRHRPFRIAICPSSSIVSSLVVVRSVVVTVPSPPVDYESSTPSLVVVVDAMLIEIVPPAMMIIRVRRTIAIVDASIIIASIDRRVPGRMRMRRRRRRIRGGPDRDDDGGKCDGQCDLPAAVGGSRAHILCPLVRPPLSFPYPPLPSSRCGGRRSIILNINNNNMRG